MDERYPLPEHIRKLGKYAKEITFMGRPLNEFDRDDLLVLTVYCYKRLMSPFGIMDDEEDE